MNPDFDPADQAEGRLGAAIAVCMMMPVLGAIAFIFIQMF